VAPGHPLPDTADAPPFTVAEALAVGATVGVALVGTASLALAQLGHHNGIVAVAIGAAALLGIAALAYRGGLRPALGVPELILAGIIALVSLFMSLPGFPYAYVDKDPGIYVAHALTIARDGDAIVDDPVLAANLPGVLISPGARFTGVWTEGDEHATSQFFHYFSALTATGIDLTDERAAFHLNALLGALSAVVLALAARRAFGLPTAVIAGGLLAIALPQVWQTKYPTTEILAQLLMGGAMLAAAIAADRRSPVMGLITGGLVGIGFLARPDGLVLVAVTIAAIGLLVAFDRVEATVWGVAIGLAITLPYALVNAYGLRREYTLVNEVPDLPVVAALAVGGLLLARALRPVATRAGPWLAEPETQRRLGTVVAVGFALVLLFFAYRERLLGEAYTDLLGATPRRSYDEINLRRLSFFLSRVVWPIAVVGLAVVGRQRWRTARWIVLVPGLCLLPVYLWEAQVSPRLMWWVRRFVPGVVPVVLLLVAVALGWCLTQRRWALRGVAAVALVVLAVGYVDRSWPLRSHREMAGSYEMARAIAGTAGDQQGLFLWERPASGQIFNPTRNFPTMVWWGFGELSAQLPDAPTQAGVDEYAARFPDNPVFVVSASDELPGTLSPDAFERVADLEAALPFWEEAVLERPQHATEIQQQVTVWRLDDARS